jgi:G:T/U-mismatch repair DNA glycosylase
MQGRDEFTSAEADKIRKLLRDKQRANRTRQKALRQSLRSIGFYITDFGSSPGGFGPSDFDRLVRAGRIRITDDAPASDTNVFLKVWAWLQGLFMARSSSEGEKPPPTRRAVPFRRLEPLLRPRLDVVFVGTEPGPTSLRLGHYYANPDNTFYADLEAVGFTPGRVSPHQFESLLTHGIGLDDVYDDPAALRSRLETADPKAICFNSKGALQRFVGIDLGRWEGSAASSYVNIGNALIWAVPDSSPRAFRYHERRIGLLIELRKRLR